MEKSKGHSIGVTPRGMTPRVVNRKVLSSATISSAKLSSGKSKSSSNEAKPKRKLRPADVVDELDNNDEDLLMYNSYLQMCYVNSMHEKACLEQDKLAQNVLSCLAGMISELQTKEKDILFKLELVKYLKIIINQIQCLEQPLLQADTKLSQITTIFNEFHSAVTKTRSKLLLKNVSVDDTDSQLLSDLKETSVSLEVLNTELVDTKLDKTADNLQDTCRLIRKKKEIQSQCERLLLLVDNLTITESSLAISNLSLDDN